VPREPTPEEVAAALAASSRVGLYFAAWVGRPEPAPEPAEPTRSPLRTLADFYANRDLLDAALGDMAARLGCGERRVAASTLYLGHAARVWSIALGSWAVGGLVPHLAPETVCWNVAAGRPTELVVTAPTGRRLSPADVDADVGVALEAITAAVVDAHLRPFADVLRRATGTAAGLLWGNAASALVGAVQVLESRQGPEPDGVVPAAAVDAARRLAARLLERPPLTGTTRHRVDADGRLVLRGVMRRSCCLFYRAPDGGTCGDCPLTGSPAAARRRGAATAGIQLNEPNRVQLLSSEINIANYNRSATTRNDEGTLSAGRRHRRVPPPPNSRSSACRAGSRERMRREAFDQCRPIVVETARERR
jgi:hypothetical protein